MQQFASARGMEVVLQRWVGRRGAPYAHFLFYILWIVMASSTFAGVGFSHAVPAGWWRHVHFTAKLHVNVVIRREPSFHVLQHPG